MIDVLHAGDSQVVMGMLTHCMIVQCTLQFAIKGSEVNVVVDDTNVLVLLVHHALETEHGKYIFSFKGKKTFEDLTMLGM